MFFTKRLQIALKLFFVFLFICCNIFCYSQNCTPVFNKTYYGSGNDEALDIVTTADGGMIVTGRTSSNSAAYDGFLLKLSNNGTIQWSKTYGGLQFDELSKVKQTADGGYIVVGTSKSFGSMVGEAWLMKTDATGNITWSRTINKGGLRTEPRRLIQLSDGGYAAAFNIEDSTIQGDALLIKTDPSGNIIWSKVFDNGNDDGLNYIVQDGATLLVGGWATVSDREAILMRLNLGNGTVMWAKQFARMLNVNDEVVFVDTIPGGISFATSSTWKKSVNGNNPYILTYFKTAGDNLIYMKRRVQPSTNTGTVMQRVEIRNTIDGGYVYTVNDTTASGFGNFRKMEKTGLGGWMRNQSTFGSRWLKGLDLFGNGYVVAGYMNGGFATNNRRRIQVLKTDFVGKTGACSWNQANVFSDTASYLTGTFNWSNITSPQLNSTAISPAVNVLALNTGVNCEDNYCAAPDPTVDTVCYASVLTHLKEYGYSFIPIDLVKVNGGYLVTGYNRIYSSVEPMIVRVRSNGTVAWAKTFSFYIHSSTFDQVILASDGDVIVTGTDSYTIANTGYISTAILKLKPSDGTVVWSKYLQGQIYDLQQGDNGGIVGCHTTAYGFPPMYISLFKMDLQGNITWQKQLNQNFENHPIFRRVVYDGQYFYGVGEYYNQNNNTHIQLEKIDAAGNRIWAKTFQVNGLATYAQHLDMIGDSIYLFTYNYVNSTNPSYPDIKLSVLKIHKDGQGLNGVTLSNLNGVTDNVSYWSYNGALYRPITKTDDNNFVFGNRVKAINDSSLVLTKFSPLGQVIWSRRYDNLNNHFVSSVKDDQGAILLLGRSFKGTVDDTYSFETLLMRTDQNGIVAANATGFCHSVPVMYQTSPATITYGYTFPRTQTNGVINPVADTVIKRDFIINSVVGCGIPANCSFVDISGQQTVCSFSDTITYSIQRNTTCTVPVQWRYDTTGVTTIGQTDTTLRVRFTSNGTKTIKAVIQSGCGLIIDSIQVNIPVPAATLNLGPDQILCAGNSALLNAHKGYNSYLWNDGSTDSTLAVTQTGTYFVTVTDSCGNNYRDTINVLPHPPIPFNAGTDRVKCNNDTLHLNAPPGFANYSWTPAYNINSTNTQNVVVAPAVDTSYFIRAELTPGCYAYDTVRVTVYQSPKILLGNDTSFCVGKSVSLDAGMGFSNYLWNTGSTAQSLTVTTAGTYHIVATTMQGCISSDTLKVINVWSLPVTQLDKNPELCTASSRTLDPGNFAGYLWNNGSTGRIITVNNVGVYYVDVIDVNGCRNTDTVRITTLLPLPSGFLPNDTSVCSYGTLALKPVQNFQSYLWSNGSTLSTITVSQPGKYWLQVQDGKNCIGSDTLLVALKQCMEGLYVPNAFTPNQDGKNDVFRAMLFGNIKTFEFAVYDRWGEVIFKTNDPSKGWDGRIAGRMQASGVFVWRCQYQLEGGAPTHAKGTVVLIQ